VLWRPSRSTSRDKAEYCQFIPDTKDVGVFLPHLNKKEEDWITVYIENISSKDRGRGYASKALEELKKIADKHGIILRLWPLQSEKKRGVKDFLSTPQLKKWYERKGFGKDISSGSWGKDTYKDFPEQTPLYLERRPGQIKDENIQNS